MNRALLGGLLLALCFLSGQSSISRADDAKPKKDSQKKDDDKSKDKKPDGVKRAQTTSVGTFSGKLTKVDDAMLAFEAGQGRAKKTIEDVIIADDVKVRLPAEPEFDSKGKPKKFKPDPNDPDRSFGGVKGSKDDLREGQQVVIKLGKHNKKLVATVIVVLPEEKK